MISPGFPSYCNFTLGNSNLQELEPPANSRHFFFPFRSFLCSFTLDNLHYVLRAWQFSALPKIELISKQPCILCLYFFVSPVEIQCSALLFKILIIFCHLLISFFLVICFKLLMTRTLDNCNRFLFPKKVWIIRSQLYMCMYESSSIMRNSVCQPSTITTVYGPFHQDNQWLLHIIFFQYKGSATRCHYRPCKTETW